MNFQQLEYVLAVHKHKHFGLAAESCHITQATLSAMIKKLEQELNIIIFDRSRKPVKTTDVGLIFIEKSKLILLQKNALFELNNTSEMLEGEITIGVIPTVATSLLPLILPEIMSKNPELTLTIVEVTTEQIKQQLVMDKIDLGIVATPIKDDRFEEHIMYYEPMMVYGIENKNKSYVTSTDVKNQSVWLLEEGHCFRNQMLTICEIQEKEMKQSNLNFKGNSFETLLNLANTFGGLTLIPELYYNDLNEVKKAKTKHFEPPIPVREISIINYRQFANAKAIAYLSKIIQEIVSQTLTTNNYNKQDLDIIGI